MHNHDNKENSWMMWGMMVCCAALILFILLFGAGVKAFGLPSWIIVIGIIAFIIMHFVMMKKSHNHSNNVSGAPDKKEGNDKIRGSHSNHDCYRKPNKN